MCGISGIVANNIQRYSEEQKQMIHSMNHRGPDEQSSYSFGNCSLGHNRLSIVDIATGNQPMLNPDSTIGIAFNGEIYGSKDIRQRVNYPYRTESDTELILALYSQKDIQLLDMLPGMFSFAIWDEKKQRLFAARDRFGEKPFYYSITDSGALIFASEIKAIIASNLVAPQIDDAAVARYLNHGYTGPWQSIYKNIKPLPPAHYLTYSNGKIDVKRYWNYPATTTERITISDAADRFESLFDTAVKKQMVADVEVCAFLSGGLDSTSIVKAASHYNKSLKTLAYGYKGESSELPFAKLAADAYHTNHIELLEKDVKIEDIFLKLPHIYDEPFSDSSAIATYLICKEASKHCKVVLTGDAGDELLGGYVWWYKPIIEQLQHKNTGAALYSFVYAMAAAEKIGESTINKSSSRKWRDKYHTLRTKKQYPTPLASIQSRFDWLTDEERQWLQLPEQPRFIPTWAEDATINDAMKYDIADYMAGDILVKTDRAAMANSLELRSPFLDVDLASFCISMPGELKVDSNKDKILLREAMGKYWPKEIQTRPKQGFGLTKDTWTNSPSMQGLYAEYVHSRNSALYNILPYEGVQRLIKNKKNSVHQLFILGLWASKQK